MPLDLPNLDDLTWQQLAELGRASIPGRAPEWTNHNAADPGIMLVELFAYLSETLIYRANRVSAANMWAFLRLVNGPEWKPPRDSDLATIDRTNVDRAGLEKARLNKARTDTLNDLRHTRRAVTAEDFESLALAAAKDRIARAKAVFGRNLAGDDPSSGSPGHVSVIVVPNAERGTVDSGDDLLQRVRKVLEPACLLTTRLHVVQPRYLNFGVQATLLVPTTADPHKVREQAIAALKKFFDPLEGGPRLAGWPFGRSLYVSEVYELLAKLPGVKTAARNIDHRTGRSIDELVVLPAESQRRRLNQDGRLEAVLVEQHELVRLEIQEADIVVIQEHESHG